MRVHFILEYNGVRRGPVQLVVGDPSSTTVNDVMNLLHDTNTPSQFWKVPQVEFRSAVKVNHRDDASAPSWGFLPNLPLQMCLTEEDCLVVVPSTATTSTATSTGRTARRTTTIRSALAAPAPGRNAKVKRESVVVPPKSTARNIRSSAPPLNEPTRRTGRASAAALVSPPVAYSGRNSPAGSVVSSASSLTTASISFSTTRGGLESLSFGEIMPAPTYEPGSEFYVHNRNDGIDYPVEIIRPIGNGETFLCRYFPPYQRTTTKVQRGNLLLPTTERIEAYDRAKAARGEMDAKNRSKERKKAELAKEVRNKTLKPSQDRRTSGGKQSRSKSKVAIKKAAREARKHVNDEFLQRFGPPLSRKDLPSKPTTGDSSSIIFEHDHKRRVYFITRDESMDKIAMKLGVEVERVIHDNRSLDPAAAAMWTKETIIPAGSILVAPVHFRGCKVDMVEEVEVTAVVPGFTGGPSLRTMEAIKMEMLPTNAEILSRPQSPPISVKPEARSLLAMQQYERWICENHVDI